VTLWLAEHSGKSRSLCVKLTLVFKNYGGPFAPCKNFLHFKNTTANNFFHKKFCGTNGPLYKTVGLLWQFSQQKIVTMAQF